MADTSQNCPEIYAGNFPCNYTEKQVEGFFAGYDVLGVRKFRKQDQVYAFVKFARDEMAQQVIEDYKNVTLDGRKLVLQIPHRQCEAVNIPQETDSIEEPDSKRIDDSDMPPLGEIPEHIRKKLIMFLKYKQNLCAEVPQRIAHEDVKVGNNIAETIQQVEAVDKNNVANGQIESTGFCNPLSKVIICDFPSMATEDDLLELFGQYCPIKCKVMTSGLPDCEYYFTYAYVFLPSAGLAAASAADLNGTVYRGTKISVKHVYVRK